MHLGGESGDERGEKLFPDRAEAAICASNSSTNDISSFTFATIRCCSAREWMGTGIESHLPLFRIARVVLLDFFQAASENMERGLRKQVMRINPTEREIES